MFVEVFYRGIFVDLRIQIEEADRYESVEIVVERCIKSILDLNRKI